MPTRRGTLLGVDGLKQCTKCQRTLPGSQYHSDVSKKDKLNSSCRDCHKKLQRSRWANKTPEERLHAALQRYKLSVENYNELLRIQGNKCAICNEELTEGRLFVDHCHETKEVRGLLCLSCNFGLGHFKNDLDLLDRAIAYLRLAHMKVT